MASSAAASSFATGAAAFAKKTNRRHAGGVRRTAAPTRAAVSDPAVARVPVVRTTDAIFTDTLAEGVQVIRCVCQERLKFEAGLSLHSTPGCHILFTWTVPAAINCLCLTAGLSLPRVSDWLHGLSLPGCHMVTCPSSIGCVLTKCT
jgi:hypothetical protein